MGSVGARFVRREKERECIGEREKESLDDIYVYMLRTNDGPENVLAFLQVRIANYHHVFGGLEEICQGLQLLYFGRNG